MGVIEKLGEGVTGTTGYKVGQRVVGAPWPAGKGEGVWPHGLPSQSSHVSLSFAALRDSGRSLQGQERRKHILFAGTWQEYIAADVTQLVSPPLLWAKSRAQLHECSS